MKVIKQLKGNSGCGVFLIEDEERGLVVRKIAGSSLYSARLEQQYFKQKSFSHNLVKAPKIFKSGVNNDLFYFDMEYVKGESFHNFISTHTPAESLTILKSIFSIYKSKVFSDLMFGWSWRKKNNFPFVKNIIILQELQANLTHAEKELHKRLICLHLLRALPYSKDALTEDFLKKSLDYFL